MAATTTTSGGPVAAALEGPKTQRHSHKTWTKLRGLDRRFLLWIQSALDEKSLVEIPVQARYGPSEMFDERWFEAPSGQRWRLVAPEPPFLGVFLMVEEDTQR